MTGTERLLRVGVWSAVAFGAAIGLLNMTAMVVMDRPGDYVEGVVLVAQEGVGAGASPYDPERWREPPYRINLYGPVGYQLGGWLAAALRSGRGSLIPGRLVALLAVGMALAAVWRLERRVLELGAAPAALGVLVPLGLLPVVVFGAQNRVDGVAVAFGLWGLVLAAEGGWRLSGAAALFVLAVYTKPTAVAAPAALGLWWLWERRLRDLSILCGLCLVLGLGALGAMTVATGGAFLQSVFGFNALPFALGGLVHAVQQAFGGGLLALAAGVALAALAAGRPGERPVALYLLLSLAVAFATVGRVGANFNYFVEASLAAGPVLALAWSRAGRAGGGGGAAPWPAVAVPAVALLMAGAALLWSGPRVVAEWRGRAERGRTEARLEELIRPGETVLTLEVTSITRLGAVAYLNDPSIFARLAEGGLWDQSRLLADLESGRIDWVLADEDMAAPRPPYSNWTDETRRGVAAHYELAETLGGRLRLYRPRPAGEPP